MSGHPEGAGRAPLDRRDFIRSLGAGWVGLLVSGTAGLGAGCAGLSTAPYRMQDGVLLVEDESLEPVGMALLDNPEGGRPILLARLASGEFSAVLTRCPREGCRVDPEDERIVCPCGGSTFSLTGRVLSGPAEEDLVSYPVTRRGDGTLAVAWSPRSAGR